MGMDLREKGRKPGVPAPIVSFSPDSVGTDGCSPPVVRSIEKVVDHPPPRARPVRRLNSLTETDKDRTEWVKAGDRDDSPEADVRRRALNTKITYVCEAAASRSGLSAWHHAGVKESTFKAWRKDRNLFYWSDDDVSEAIEERMALDGYKLARPRDADLLRSLVDAAEVGYRLYKLAALAHGIEHPS